MLAGIRDILLITNKDDIFSFQKLLGDGSAFGVSIEYCIQHKPTGIPDAFIIAEDFLDGHGAVLILGDNFFYSEGLSHKLELLSADYGGAKFFALQVNDPEHYGVVSFNEDGSVADVIEKPKTFVTDWAIPGLYYFDGRAVAKAKMLKPSSRGETEIVDLIKSYLDGSPVEAIKLGRGCNWFDMGRVETVMDVANFVASVQTNKNELIGSPEEVAVRKGWITVSEVLKSANELSGAPYFATLARCLAKSQ